MHQVIRKRQGLTWTPEQPKGFAANGNHLVGVAVRAAPFPTDQLGLAYGDRAQGKLVQQVTAPDEALRRKALEYVCEKLRSAREVASFVPAGIVPALNKSAEHRSDTLTSTLATAALLPLAKDLRGREQMLNPASSSVPVVLRLACDSSPHVRRNSVAVILELGKFAEGARQLIAGGCVKLLVRRCVEEDEPQTLVAVLGALRTVMDVNQEGLDEGIEEGAIATIVQLLDVRQPAEVCEQAYLAIATLTVGGDEKTAALKLGIMPHMLAMIGGTNDFPNEDPAVVDRVCTAALAGLMSLTIADECKMEAVRLGGVRALAPIAKSALASERRGQLSYANSTQFANATKCIANLAEHPMGRSKLKSTALPNLKPLAVAKEPIVQKHTQIAVEKVEWMP